MRASAALPLQQRRSAFPACGESGDQSSWKSAEHKAFSSTQKGVRLTTEGKLLYPYVERGMENPMDGEEMLKRLVDMDMGEVRIGASDMTLQFTCSPVP